MNAPMGRAALIAVCLTGGVAGQATFTSFNGGSGALSILAWGISGDGLTVVGSGNVNSSEIEAWSFTPSAGFHWFGGSNTVAIAVSADGAVIAGAGEGVCRWVRGLLLPIPPGPEMTPERVGGISGDGSTVVGSGYPPGESERPYRWNAAAGFTNLGLLPGYEYGWATGVSADGSVVVGWNLAESGSTRRAFRWTASRGLEALEPLPGDQSSYALAISADGTAIVGQSAGNQGSVACMWSAEPAPVAIPPLPGAAYESATGVSFDGSVVGGVDNLGRAFVWTRTGGTRLLSDVLRMYGADPGTFQFDSVFVSYNGRTLAGQGFDHAAYEGWYAVLPPGFGCYANCDGSTATPVLNVNDFLCFMSKFAAGDSYANCDQSTTPPILNVNDFLCFTQQFAGGCS